MHIETTHAYLRTTELFITVMVFQHHFAHITHENHICRSIKMTSYKRSIPLGQDKPHTSAVCVSHNRADCFQKHHRILAYAFLYIVQNNCGYRSCVHSLARTLKTANQNSEVGTRMPADELVLVARDFEK